MSEPCSVRAREKTVIDVHENSGFNWEKKPASRARVSGNRCKGEIRTSSKNRFYACQFSHKTRKDAMATSIEGWTHKKHSLIWNFIEFIFRSYSLQQVAQKCDRFWFILILSYRFHSIRSQLETVLDFWLVNVCMKECELIKGGHTFGLLAVKSKRKFEKQCLVFLF